MFIYLFQEYAREIYCIDVNHMALTLTHCMFSCVENVKPNSIRKSGHFNRNLISIENLDVHTVSDMYYFSTKLLWFTEFLPYFLTFYKTNDQPVIENEKIISGLMDNKNNSCSP